MESSVLITVFEHQQVLFVVRIFQFFKHFDQSFIIAIRSCIEEYDTHLIQGSFVDGGRELHLFSWFRYQ